MLTRAPTRKQVNYKRFVAVVIVGRCSSPPDELIEDVAGRESFSE